jgi:hypothetical protein
MHRFIAPLDEFMWKIRQQFAIEESSARSLLLSLNNLPKTLIVIGLLGVEP